MDKIKLNNCLMYIQVHIIPSLFFRKFVYVIFLRKFVYVIFLRKFVYVKQPFHRIELLWPEVILNRSLL